MAKAKKSFRAYDKKKKTQGKIISAKNKNAIYMNKTWRFCQLEKRKNKLHFKLHPI